MSGEIHFYGFLGMPLRILCPQGHALVVSQARGGSTLRCPKCGASVVVPPEVPRRETAAIGAEAVPTGASESPALKAAAAIAVEPEPPPVVTAIGEVAPPPVWAPPPKSRVIPDAAPTSPPPPPPAEGEKLPANERPLPPEEAGPPPATSVTAPAETPVATAPPTPVAKESPPASAVPITPPLDVPAVEAPAAAPPQPESPAPEADIAPDSSAPSSLDPLPLVPGASQQLGAYILSICFAAAALFSAAPAVWDIVQYAQAVEGAYVARWALVVLALGVVQVAYAIYLAQLPDWTSGWVITLFALATAAIYAAMLGVTLIAGDDSRLIRSLQLTEFMATGRASMWCLCMTTIMATLAFFGGRTSLRWRLAEAAGR